MSLGKSLSKPDHVMAPKYGNNTGFVTLQHKTRLKSQILESEILVLCESVLQELSTNIFNIIDSD
jgi:hypothetical protein